MPPSDFFLFFLRCRKEILFHVESELKSNKKANDFFFGSLFFNYLLFMLGFLTELLIVYFGIGFYTYPICSSGQLSD